MDPRKIPEPIAPADPKKEPEEKPAQPGVNPQPEKKPISIPLTAF